MSFKVFLSNIKTYQTDIFDKSGDARGVMVINVGN